jgi:nitrate reductase NapE component
MSVDALPGSERKPSGWRMSLALVLWVGGFFLPLLIPLVIALPLPMATRSALSGLLVFGLPQLLTIIAIALVGKSGFHYLMEQLFGAAKKLGPPAHVSRRRYRIGLVMLFLPLALSIIEPYLTLLVVDEHLPRWVHGAAADTLFLASFFVLGGEFWDKVKALFIYEARAVLPAMAGSSGADATTVGP